MNRGLSIARVCTSLVSLVTAALLSALAHASEHPRLLGTASEFRELGSALAESTLFSKAIARAKSRIDPLLDEPPEVPVPQDPGGGYTHERHKANAVVIAEAGALFQWTGDKAYAELVRDLLLAYAELYPGLGPHPVEKSNNRGRLFWQKLNESVWLVYAIQGYDAAFDQIDLAERARIESGVLRPLARFLSVESPKYFNRLHNHGTWAAAAVGMTGYALGDADLVDMALLGTGKDGDGGFLAQLDSLFSPDGYYLEGPYYQRYAIMPFVVFAKAIEVNEPDRRIFEFRDGVVAKAIETLVQLSYAGLFFPVNDALRDKGIDTMELDHAIPIAYEVSSDPAYLSLVNEGSSLVLMPAALRLALDKEAGKETPFAFASRHFRDGARGDQGGLTVLRAGEGPGHAALLFKATSHGMGHGHFDRLHWMFYDNGVDVVADYGAARFLNVPQKAGGRYLPENTTWAKQTIAHNTPVVGAASQFNGDVKRADQSVPSNHVFVQGDGVQLVSAEETAAYPGTRLARTMLLIEWDELAYPLVLDILDVRSDSPRAVDLPLYFKGELIDAMPALVAQPRLRALGEENGYQHLWRLGSGQASKDTMTFTWLRKGRFYTYGVSASQDLEAVYTRVGAGDPDFNLRPEQGLLFRARNAKDFRLVAYLEPHGQYSGSREFTTGSEGQIAGIIQTTRDGKDLFVIETKSGKRLPIALARKST